LNYLLSLKKKYLLLIISLLISISLIVLIYKAIQKNIIQNEDISINLNGSDITNPRFTINSKNQKISITANQGNFINNEEILLKNNVVFESNKFTIFSDDVIFNKTNQTASSQQKSKFVSNNTSILSDGFEIVEEGNKIKFNGKTTIKLK